MQAKTLDIGDLFARAFERWKRRVWTLLGMILSVVLIMGAWGLLLAGIIVAFHAGGSIAIGIGLACLLGLPTLVWGIGWLWAAYYLLVTDDSMPLTQALSQARQHAWGIQVALFLPSIAIVAGLLLCLLPGLALMPFVAMVPFAYFGGARGLSASYKSRSLVQPQYWMAFLLALLAYIIPNAGSVIPILGIFITLALSPFSALLLHEVYKDLCALNPDASEDEDPQAKAVLYGSLILVILAMGAAAGFLLPNFDAIMEEFLFSFRNTAQ